MAKRGGQGKRRRLNPMSFWLDISISMKTLFVQTVLFVFPLAVCVIMFFSLMYLNILQQNAQRGYEYGRYVMDSFEADMLRIKSIAKIITANQQTRSLLTGAGGAEGEDVTRQVNLLIAGTADNHTKVGRTTLYATGNACASARARLPLWDGANGYASGWRYQDGESGESARASWVEVVYKDTAPVGVLEICLNETILPDMADNIAGIVGGSCIVQSRTGKVLCASAGMDEATLQKLRGLQGGSEGIQTLSRLDYAMTMYCGAMELTFLAAGTVEPSYNIISGYMTFLVSIVAVLLLMTFVSVWLNHIGITRRIKRLDEQIRRQTTIGQLDSLQPIEATGRDEIGTLAQNYNLMQHRMVELAERERAAQTMQQTARFSALQAQIQPHFLYNTLETLRMMADEHDDMEVADMLFVLGKLMRSSISGKEQEIELTREIENIKNYLLLNQLRYTNLRYEIVVDADVDGLKCPRFILQPLVENSVHHGISRSRGDGFLQVRIYEEGEDCLVDIRDNGVGIAPERLAEIQRSLGQDAALSQEQGGIGIVNVHKRLKIYFGGRSGLEIMSRPGEGTLCRVRMQRGEGGRQA